MDDIANCFLCAPDPRLVYCQGQGGVALCGLGQIVPAYTVIGAPRHIASGADAISAVPGFAAFAEHIRDFLALEFGSCLITEHGRAPLCGAEDHKGESHCYHAHFLAFPNAPDVEDAAEAEFECVTRFGTLAQALAAAGGHSEYLLLSPNPKLAILMQRPRQMFRQFARVVVANAIGNPAASSWRRSPTEAAAIDQATRLRQALSSPRGHQ